ncbi:hypothetical protein PybrP1_006844 [[Pythium] brassicae (nom. inval.)]|nr:hypothetical protein PybrP1_006844 [[Pythium] brassicae (nom. inval.)]
MQDQQQQQDAQRFPGDSDDASAAAHEIIRNRFQIELRADTLRKQRNWKTEREISDSSDS